MLNNFLLLIAATLFAYASQVQTERCIAADKPYKKREDPGYIALIILFVAYAGFRTDYNDTQNYVRMFRDALPIGEYIFQDDAFNIFANPLYYFFQSLLRTVTSEARWLILLTSAYIQICLTKFIKRYSINFAFSVFIYICLGTFSLTMAAIKQALAMATLTLAIPYLEKKKWVPFYVIVFIAMLFHTYALAFAVLPLFTLRPWRAFTFVFVIASVAVLMNFESVISTFLEQADEAGKSIAEYEVFDEYTVNLLRVAVYAVVPILSFIFSKWLFEDSLPIENLFVHMSIISLAFMSLGTQAGANMFGRMATYFELGTVCCLPWLTDKVFEERSAGAVEKLAAVCFFGFFAYGNLF